MELLIANVDNIEFKIERDLNEQFGALPLPFPGMDSKLPCLQLGWESNEFILWIILQSPRLRFVNFSMLEMVPNVTKVPLALSGIFAATGRLSANIGCVDYAKKETNVNFCTNMTWRKCQSATFIQDSTPATIRNARSYTLTRRAR